MGMGKTPTALLIEHKLGRSLAKYVKSRQAEGLGWRRIAGEIRKDTGVVVSHESLRTWFTAADTEDAA